MERFWSDCGDFGWGLATLGRLRRFWTGFDDFGAIFAFSEGFWRFWSDFGDSGWGLAILKRFRRFWMGFCDLGRVFAFLATYPSTCRSGVAVKASVFGSGDLRYRAVRIPRTCFFVFFVPFWSRFRCVWGRFGHENFAFFAKTGTKILDFFPKQKRKFPLFFVPLSVAKYFPAGLFSLPLTAIHSTVNSR